MSTVNSKASEVKPYGISYAEAARSIGEDRPAEAVAREAISGLPPRVIRSLAVAYLTMRIDQAARQMSRSVERRQHRADDIYRTTLTPVVAAIREQLRAEWSGELLASEFVVDGRRVTWGDATIQDHESRAVILRSRAEGHLVTARKHEEAMRVLDHLGSRSLNLALSDD